MTKNLPNAVITATVIVAAGLWAHNAQARPYLSDYSGGSGLNSSVSSNHNNGGSSYDIHIGGNASYRSRVGSGSITTTHQNRHRASIARQQKQLEAQKIRHHWYNSNPPCGVYGRLPERCRRAPTNLAPRN